MKQFAKLNIQLVIRSTDYNRFQEKMLKGTAQIFQWGWNADYPDPENFLFLLYGPNSKVELNGENAANYQNDKFDELFDRMKDMENGPERQTIISHRMRPGYGVISRNSSPSGTPG
jgi:ABC-type oligopeptide transport system substrate-binding subunit